MRFFGGGYNEKQFHHEKLRTMVKRLSLTVPHGLKLLGADAMVCTGKSGIAVATALLASIDVNVVHVRKQGESSHGSMIEGSGREFGKFIVFDDFVASGATVRTVLERLSDSDSAHREDDTWCPYENCMGVFVYQHNHDSDASRTAKKRPDASVWAKRKHDGKEFHYPIYHI